jgi:DNA-binding NtrC family response regulator
VEDEESMRQLASEYLSGKGYRVLTAADPDSAVTLAAAHLGLIDMLLTDVILPGMSGVKLAESLAPTHPNMRVLYVSGYTADAIVHHGGQGPNFAFLSKPFSLSALARKIRSVLDERAAANCGDAVSVAIPVEAKSSSN